MPRRFNAGRRRSAGAPILYISIRTGDPLDRPIEVAGFGDAGFAPGGKGWATGVAEVIRHRYPDADIRAVLGGDFCRLLSATGGG